ncbi:MAG: hypothetical protein HQ503_02405 [Rhodospirillales bacterium]|nr:hypothetical protein [Rhodospirillales bacterium]
MSSLMELVEEAQGLVARLAGGADADLGALKSRLEHLAMPAYGETGDIDRLRAAVAADRAAAELAIGARALAEAGGGDLPEGAEELLAQIGYLQSIAGLNRLAHYAVPADFSGGGEILEGDGAAPEAASPAASGLPKDLPQIQALRNISAYHREHARFHAHFWMERGAELIGEASRIKIVADHWLKGGGPKPDQTVDYSDPRFSSAPCTDLNVLAAIHNLGILFLEGSGEPPEIAILKRRLRDLADAIGENGSFLASKMGDAWTRESILLAPNLIATAWPRLQVVVSNWRCGLSMVTTAKLLGNALRRLDEIDFTPAQLRRDLFGAGTKLLEAGWALDMAAKLCAETGSGMADNDWRYARYSAFLGNLDG